MDENLIGYLLEALDERTMREVETILKQDPAARERLFSLRQALAPLAADRVAPPAPTALTWETLARIAQHECASRQDRKYTDDLPRAPALSPASRAGGRAWWRRADVLVAACVLVMAAGIGLTALTRLRSSAMIADCRNNLQQLFVALQQYRLENGHFPDISQESPRNVAGMVMPMLIDAGKLPDYASIRCPGIGEQQVCSASLAVLRSLDESEFAQQSPCLSMCYAYSLGYRDGDGNYRVPGTDPRVLLSQQPIMADRPPEEDMVGNSSNHGGAGQNVLFADGHVLFLLHRSFGNEDDIFLNRDRKIAAGLDPADVVLGASAARP